MKKKFLTAALVLGMTLALGGCGKSAEKSEVLDRAAKIVTLGEYKGLTMTVDEVTEASVNSYIDNNLLTPNVTYEQIKEGTVKEGDVANINYVGKKDGVAFDGGSEDGRNLTIGSGSFIEGFEEGLIGVKVGDTVDLNLTFPEDYGKEDLNGQDVVFTVTVNYIQGKAIVPELTDELVKASSGTEYDNVADYTTYINNLLNEQNTTAAENEVYSIAVDNAKLSEYPEEDMEEALGSMLNYYKSMASYYQTDVNSVLGMYGSSEETFNDDMKDAAQMFVADKLVALAIAKKEGIKITDEIYKTKTDEYLETYGYESLDKLEETVPKDKILEQIYVDLGKQLVIDNAVK